ncbi:MAG TPA: ABC transporter substrate-binding protein [Sphingomicrobium sp.]|nr:ABC transporter substrate-binding protein [Sphingomicrobium sp.]
MRLHAIRRSLALAAVVVLCAALAGCDRKSDGVVQVTVIGGEPRLADPRAGPLGASEAVLVANAAQGLVRFDASGQIVPGLAETWNVSDDGLSYIFRLATTQWPNGRPASAEQVARMLRRTIARSGRNPMKDAFGAVDEIVAMTDRVIEIRLRQPRPHLLQLLAQPAMGLVYDEQGTGPFAIDRPGSTAGKVRLVRELPTSDEERTEREQLDLSGASAGEAVRAFVAGDSSLVLGGTFADLPFARAIRLPRRALQFDPASGLFGLVPSRKDGPLSNPEVRRLLSAAIDRDALVSALSVPGLLPRMTVLEPDLDNVPDPAPPQWSATPLAERRPALAASARQLFAGDEPPVIRIALPKGPGAAVLLNRLAQDWGAIGVSVERAREGALADLKLIDQVAPSSSASWFLRQFRCEIAAICDADVDEILEGARSTPVLAQRSALLTEASRRIDDLQLFIPIAAPIRWSLVSPRITGFAGNRFAVHTLTGLEQRLERVGE